MTTQQKTSAITLDPFTLKVLSNFSRINNGLIIKAGSELRTMSESRNILAEATVPDVFPVDFAITDFRQLLSIMGSLFDKPQIAFYENHLQIISGSDMTRMYYCNPDLIAAPTKRVSMPSEDISFTLTNEVFEKISKSSTILQVDDLQFSSIGDDSDMVKITVLDKSNPATNIWESKVSANYSKPFSVYFKIDNLKLMDGPYSISISNKGICRFKNTTSNLIYYICPESDSKF